MKYRHLLISVAAAVLLSACASTGERDTTDTAADRERAASERDTRGTRGERDRAEPVPLTEEEKRAKQQAELARQNVVYFDFDSSELKREAQRNLERHADFLTRNPNARVRLEGHTDERGTREYNIGLGERRAQSVARVLSARGVSREQFSIVSYGEERPAQLGSNEEAWAKNRRVEINYR